MNVARPSRVIAAIITTFSLLFTQLALASYRCPGLYAAKPQAMVADAMKMSDCASMDMDMDMDLPGLCHSHCEAESQTADTPSAPLVQPFVAAELTVVLSPAEPVAPSHAARTEGVLLKRSTAPPLAIRNCCFRI
jgi:hypothetical protein